VTRLSPYWREVMQRKERIVPELICPMKPLSLPYRERLCKIATACYIDPKDGVAGHTECRIRPAEDPETCQSCGTELGADDDAYDGYCQHCG
jgi:hypothetical protein